MGGGDGAVDCAAEEVGEVSVEVEWELGGGRVVGGLG